MSKINTQNVTKSHQRSRPCPTNRGPHWNEHGFPSILHQYIEGSFETQAFCKLSHQVAAGRAKSPRWCRTHPRPSPEHLSEPLSPSELPGLRHPDFRSVLQPAKHTQLSTALHACTPSPCHQHATRVPPGGACSLASLRSQLTHRTPATSSKRTAVFPFRVFNRPIWIYLDG